MKISDKQSIGNSRSINKTMFQGIGGMIFLLFVLTTNSIYSQLVMPNAADATPVLTLKDANLTGISSNGLRVVISPQIGLDEVYEVPTGRKVATFKVPGSSGSQISADGKRLLVFAPIDTGKPYPPVCGVWHFDIDTGKEIKRTNTCVEYDGTFVGGIVLFSPKIEGRVSSDLRFIVGGATPASLDAKTPLIKPGIWLWDIENQKMARTFGEYLVYDSGNSDYWDNERITPDGRILTATRFNHKRPENLETIVWDAQSGQVLMRLPFASRWLAISNDGRRLVTTRDEPVSEKNKTDKTDIIVTPQGKVIASPTTKPTTTKCRPPTEIWDITTGKLFTEIGENGCNRFPMTSGSFSPDGKILATASLNYVLLWDTETGKVLASLPHDKADHDRVRSVVFNDDGQFLVMSSMAEVVKVWRVSDLLKYK